MSACERFENEGLQRFVAGEPLDAHFETCPDCRTALTGYQAVVRTLEKARDAYTPPGDWEAKVWARVQRAKPTPFRGFRWVLGAVGAATAAALALLVLPSMGGVDALELAQPTFERGPGPMVRGQGSVVGQTAAPGSVMQLSARIPRSKVGDLRVYRGNDQLVFQCATSPACIRSRDGLAARVTLDRVGTYRVVAIAAEKQLPPATGNLDADYAAAMRAGEARESAPVEVL